MYVAVGCRRFARRCSRVGASLYPGHISGQGGGFAQAVFFLFLLGIAALTLATKRPMVEALPAAGISSSALLLVAFPLSFAVRLHGMGALGPKLLLFALVITWAGDTVAYFVGRAIGKHQVCADSESEEDLGRRGRGILRDRCWSA